MAGPQFDFDAARKAGYSDAEIASYLGEQKGFDVSGAVKAGYSPGEIISHLGGEPTPSGVIDSAREGAAGVLGGMGATLHDYLGAGPVGDALTSASKSVAPANFTPANIVDDNGSVHAGNIPAWIAQRAPGIAVQLAAAKLGGRFTGGSTIGKVVGGAGAGVAMTAGNEAETAAANRTGDPNATPNAADLTRGGLTSGAENAVGAYPLTRFLPGVGNKVAATGLRGALDAAKKFTINAAAEGAGSGASDVAHQVGQTVGTPGGTNVNLPEVADATAGGSVLGAGLGSTGAARDLLNARAYREATPELMPAMRAVANRAQAAAGDRNLNAGLVSGGAAQEAGADVFHKVSSGIHSELSDAVKGLSAPLPPDAQNIIKSTSAGRVPTDADYTTLKSALGNDPAAPAILNLVQQAHALQIVKGTGELGDNSFAGGVGHGLSHHLTPSNILKTALVATIGGEGGHLITYSPEMLGALGVGMIGARLANNITGARAPMGRFVSNFADKGATPVRLAAPAAATPPGGPTVGPTGPSVPPIPTPWGPPGPAPAPPLTPQARQQMAMQAALPLRALAAQAGPNAMARTAMPALRQLAATQGPNAVSTLPPDFANMLSKPASSADPVSLLREMAARAKVQKIRDARAGQAAADAVVKQSPYIDQLVGGAQNVPSPQAGAAMGKALSAAQKLAKLQSDPEAEAIDREQTKAATKAAAVEAKAAAKAQVAPAQAPAAPVAPPQLPNVTKVTKANDKVKIENDADEYQIPSSPYASHPPDVAARKFLQDRTDAGIKTNNKNGYIAATTRNITNIRGKAAEVAAAVPGISSTAIAGQFEGAATFKAAMAHRDWLMKIMPQAAPALSHIFSDAEIKKIWKY